MSDREEEPCVPDVDGSEVGDPDYDVDQSDAPFELDAGADEDD